MARTNLHHLATRLLQELNASAINGKFEGKLRQVSGEAGLNSVRSAEAIRLLEELGRIEVEQRGRRGRDTIIAIRSTDPVKLEDTRAAAPVKTSRKSTRLDYEDLGRAVVDRLLEIARDDSLRKAQVEAFAQENRIQGDRVQKLQSALDGALDRETDLRIKLKTAEEALERAEENLRRAFGPQRSSGEPVRVDDDEAKAVLDILRSGRL
jgi:hypothetical protein